VQVSAPPETNLLAKTLSEINENFLEGMKSMDKSAIFCDDEKMLHIPRWAIFRSRVISKHWQSRVSLSWIPSTRGKRQMNELKKLAKFLLTKRNIKKVTQMTEWHA
jgi:hypothetical protein